MAYSIIQNLNAVTALRSLHAADHKAGKLMEQLASGRKIAKAADNPAALVISQQLQSQIANLSQAQSNAAEAVNMLRTAQGGQQVISDSLNRMRELTLRAANSQSAEEKMAIQMEIDGLKTSINLTVQNTTYGSQRLLDGSMQNANFQVTADGGQIISVSGNLQAENLGANVLNGQSVATLDVSSADGAQQGLQILDAAIAQVSANSAQTGAAEMSLRSNMASLQNAELSLRDTESAIAGTDYVGAIVDLTAEKIKQKASLAMISQANMATSALLKLLG